MAAKSKPILRTPEEIREYVKADGLEQKSGCAVFKYNPKRVIEIVAANLSRGLSFRDIGELTGVPHQSLHRIWKTHTTGKNPRSKRRAKRKTDETAVEDAVKRLRAQRQQELVETPLPDPLQRKFVKGILEGKEEEEAAVAAGIPKQEAKVWSQRQLEDGNMRDFVIQALAASGVHAHSMAESHAALLSARKIDPKTMAQVPDNTNRLRALELAYRVTGAMPGNEISDDDGNFEGVQINMDPKTAKLWFKAFTGREPPPPKDVSPNAVEHGTVGGEG